MTNTELLKFATTPESLRCLTELDRQRLTILHIVLSPAECPHCNKPVNQVEASNKTLDEFDAGNGESEFFCPHCLTELVDVVPFMTTGTRYKWRRKAPGKA
jgi:uncharacterized protein with PIN domain